MFALRTKTGIKPLSKLDPDAPGINYYHMFIFYLAATHEKEYAMMIYVKTKIRY